MSLAPTIIEQLTRARADLRMGVPVVLKNDQRAILVVAAEVLQNARLSDFRALGRPVLAITRWRAETLNIRCYDGDIARIALPDGADASWIRDLADPAYDLNASMKGPFETVRDDLADPYRNAIALIKEALLLPAALVVEIDQAAEFADTHRLTLIDLDEAAPLLTRSSPLHRIVSARVPLEVSKAGRLHVFRPENGGVEHYAVEIGQPDRASPVLTRLHSACFTGDLLGSLKCDCGPQLRTALQRMGEAGEGILLYLNQEGRGIGLTNKMRAYSLQDQGFDTVEANHRLGFEDDERDFRIGANILKELGFSNIRLLTNNPAKVEIMQNNGITVADRVALIAGHNTLNSAYLNTKAKKSGHIL